MSDFPEPPNPLPSGYRQLTLTADTMDYLAQYWEIRDHGEIFSWAIRLLHDLTKLDEAGWRLTLSKAEVDETTKQVTESPDYRHIIFLLKWLVPTATSYPRLPDVEMLEKVTKIVKP